MVSTWNGLEIIGMSAVGPLVDPRGILDNLDWENERANREVKFTSKAKLIGIGSVTFEPSKSHAEYTFPPSSKALNFRPDVSDPCWCCCAAHYADGIWIAVHAGSHRKNQYLALHDMGDLHWTPTGATKAKQWGWPWSKAFPTIAFSLSLDKKSVTAAVALSLDNSGIVNDETAENETGKPEQSKRLLEISLDGKVIHAVEI